MRGLILLILVVVLVGGGLKMVGPDLPLIDYPVRPIGVDTPGPAMPDIHVEPPGFGDFPAP